MVELADVALGLANDSPALTYDRATLIAYLDGPALPGAAPNKPRERWGMETRMPARPALIASLLGRRRARCAPSP